jgi:transcription elongation factor SPT6
MFDWKVKFHGSVDNGMNDDEEEEALWIAERVPDIALEMSTLGDGVEDEKKIILESIANALRFMHRDKLEPSFIKRYRKDYMKSVAVRNSLNSVMDEDVEWDRILAARTKVEALLNSVTDSANKDESAGADALKLTALKEELQEAQTKLDETAQQESQLKAELEALKLTEDDDDDELFGDDDEDEVSLSLQYEE